MKRLIVLRHGKAEQPEIGMSDFDRGLTKRGKRDASRVGEVLVENNLVPSFVVSSCAKRAIKTAQRVAKSAGFEDEILEHTELYSAGVTDILFVIRTSIPDDLQTALIVGHNPGFEHLVGLFAGAPHVMATASWAAIEFNVDTWSDVDLNADADLVGTWFPKQEETGDDNE